MKSRVIFSLSLVAAFVAGLFVVRPAAQALEALAVTNCALATPCVVGNNTKKGQGVAGVSKAGTGLVGIQGPIPTGSQTKTGVLGYSPNYGVIGYATTGAGVGVTATSTSTNALTTALAVSAPNGANLIYGQNVTSGAVLAVDSNANIHTTGKVYTMGSCSTGCSVHRGVESYAVTAASPTIEDYGEARFSGGMTFVRLDAAFANAVDLRAGYFVMLTPEFASRGLYIAQRTAAGFLVRENPGGAPSTGPFAYRIVAHPYGSANNARLPFREIQAVTVPAVR